MPEQSDHSPGEGPCFEEGQVVVFYPKYDKWATTLLSPRCEMQGDRLFVVGTIPVTDHWSSGLHGAIAWDYVMRYIVFESVEEYDRRGEQRKKANKAGFGSAADE